MSTYIFPDLAGLGWGCTRTAKWGTQVAESAAGIEYRLQQYPYPKWEWDFTYNYLRQGTGFKELEALGALFNMCAGGTLSFFLKDPQDNSTTGQYIATGDGTKTAFQLQRRWSSLDNSLAFDEPIWGVDQRPGTTPFVVYDNGVPAGGVTVNTDTGLITFPAAPAAGHTITADFSYFFRARFADDQLELTDFLKAVWQVKKLRLQQTRS